MVNHIRYCMSGIFNYAVEDQAIPINPVHGLKKLFGRKHTTQISKIDPLTKDELKHLLNTFSEWYPGHYALAFTLAYTGMRIGEALALQWGDIDYNGHFIMVQRNISRGKVDTPKNHRSRRVDMSDMLTGILRDLRRERVKMYGDNMPEWVFLNENDGFIDQNHWRQRIFAVALKQAGMRHIRIHDLRHTYASMLLQDGVPIMYVKEQLGHQTINLTVDTYGHLIPGGNRENVNRLDEIFAPKRTQGAPYPVSEPQELP